MGRRTLLLVASILVAAVGTALIFMYVNSADNRAKQGASPRPVVVAVKAIARGTTVATASSNGSFKVLTAPLDNVPTGALDGSPGLAQLDALATQAAIADIPANTILTNKSFSAPAEAATSELTKDQLAVSVQLSDPDRVASLIEPGSQVAVIATGLPILDNGKKGENPAAIYLMSNVAVIRVGGKGQSATSAETVEPKIITLAVNATEALNLKLAEASDSNLSLAVLGPNTSVKGVAGINKLSFS